MSKDTEAPKSSPNKKKAKADKVLIRLTRIKQWFIPVDADSYLALKDAGVPLTRIHQDFLPTVALITKKHGIRALEVKFKDEIMDPFFEKIGVSWNKKLHCRCSIGGRTMKFESLKPEAHKAATEAIPILQDLLEKFFSRWGFSSTFDYSEKNGRVKLNVEYWHDVNKLPVVVLEEAAEDLKPVQLKLGRTRFTLSFDNYHGKSYRDKTVTIQKDRETGEDRAIEVFGDLHHKIGYVHYLVEIAQGGKWTPAHSGKCTYTEISSVLPLITSLMNVPAMDPHNFDNLPD